MNPKSAKLFLGVLLICLINAQLRAQDAQSTLSGSVTDSAGKVLPNAKVIVKNSSTGQSTETQADAAGDYSVSNLPAGDYEVSASVEGIGTAVGKVTLTAGSPQTLNLALTSAENQPSPATPPSENLPNAPSAGKTEPSLEDLGFSKTETQGNAAQQALLDKRTHMLKIHQRMGLITTIPLVATVIFSVRALAAKVKGQQLAISTSPSVRSPATSTALLPTTPSARLESRAPKSVAPFAFTKPWPGFTAPA